MGGEGGAAEGGPATLRPPPGCRDAAEASRPCGFLSTPWEEDGDFPLPWGCVKTFCQTLDTWE